MPEYSGRTVNEAIETGLQELNLSESDAEITVLEEGHTGVFGLGSKPALVRVQPKGAEKIAQTEPQITPPAEKTQPASQPQASLDEEPVAAAEEEDVEPAIDGPVESMPTGEGEQPEALREAAVFLQNMLDLMGLNTRVEASVLPPDEEDDRDSYYLNIAGDDLGILIGRRGETLDAIQYLVRMVTHRHARRWPIVEVDVEHYKQRRELSLERLATSMADKAVREQRTIVLEAMPARERRLVHIALRDRPDVFTQSIGEGENRKVTIVPS
ncbi:MAG: protein jag [Caldilineales bacterium]|nr:protein jag [Caldilineales bacterium]